MPFGLAQIASVVPVLLASAKNPMLIHPAYVPVRDVRGLPRVLLIGDSISIGYTVPLRWQMKGKVNLHRPLENCMNTRNGLQHLDRWLGGGGWQVILFNFGLHDAIRQDRQNVVVPGEYAENLAAIVERLRATGARLVWVTTTPVPEAPPIPYEDMPVLDRAKVQEYRQEDIPVYNAAAEEVMGKHQVPMIDLYGFVLPRMQALLAPGDIHFTKPGYWALGHEIARGIAPCL
jgi:acyl-CoA thioesterase-1